MAVTVRVNHFLGNAESRRRLVSKIEAGGDRTWFPKWLAGYADYIQMVSDQPLAVDHERVVGFLRSLGGNRNPSWRRRQAARAIEAEQATVLRSDGLSVDSINSKLRELASRLGRSPVARHRRTADGSRCCQLVDIKRHETAVEESVSVRWCVERFRHRWEFGEYDIRGVAKCERCGQGTCTYRSGVERLRN